MNVFELSQSNPLSDLERISLEHGRDSKGVVFADYIFRVQASQIPYKVKKISFTTESKKDLDYNKIIRENLEPSVLILRNLKGELIATYFLPEAVNNNPYRRRISLETNIDKRLEKVK